MQEFVPHDGDLEEASARLLASLPVHEVHKIAVLDIRLCNLDRHGGNILYTSNRGVTFPIPRPGQSSFLPALPQALQGALSSPRSTGFTGGFSLGYARASPGCSPPASPSFMAPSSPSAPPLFTTDARSPIRCDARSVQNGGKAELSDSTVCRLYPIDHACCLPARLHNAWFVWLHWIQAREPMSDTIKAYIRSLDAGKDIALLAQVFPGAFRRSHFRLLYLMTEVLQQGALAQLNFYQLGFLLCRRFVSQPSPLEQLCEQHLVFSPLLNEDCCALSAQEVQTLRAIAQQAIARAGPSA